MKLEILNLEEKYQLDKLNSYAIDITEAVSVNSKKDVIRNKNGIFSSLFGGEMNDVAEIQKRYSCQCGILVGKFMEGVVCNNCGTKVSFIDNDLNMLGWITLEHDFYIIHPQMYVFLEKIFKSKNLELMIKHDKRFKIDQKMQNSPFAKYYNIGLVEFKNRFLEIMEKCAIVNESTIMEYNMVMNNLDKVFTRRIPVMSYLLRPAVMIDGKTFSSENINRMYNNIVLMVNSLNDTLFNDFKNSNYVTLQLLYQIQMAVNSVRTEIIKTKLSGKKKKIRKDTLGARLNFSSRSVLTPLTIDCPMNSIVIPYTTFIEFYKFEIMNIYMKMYGYSMIELMNKFEKLVSERDETILMIIDYLIKNTKGGLRVFLNRPPTLALGSILVLRIIAINEDLDDYTISIPLNILKPMNADFDGDVLTLVAIKDRFMADVFERYFSPLNMFVSLDTGDFNSYLMLIKGQLTSLYSFCNDDLDII